MRPIDEGPVEADRVRKRQRAAVASRTSSASSTSDVQRREADYRAWEAAGRPGDFLTFSHGRDIPADVAAPPQPKDLADAN